MPKTIEWDLEHIEDLKRKIAQLGATGEIDAVDLSALPSVEIPDDVDTDYPVWAMDKVGNMLVGPRLGEVMSISDYREIHDLPDPAEGL